MRRKKRQKELDKRLRKMKPHELRLLLLQEEVEHLEKMQLGMTGWANLLTRAEAVGEARREARSGGSS